MALLMGFNDVLTVIIALITFWFLLKLKNRPKNLPPGPWGIPILGCIPWLVFSKKDVRDTFRDWSYKYGPIYSLKMGSASMVVLNDSDSINDALIHPEFQDRTKMDYTLAAPGEGISMSSGYVWQEQRKFVHQIFREFGVGKASFEDNIVEEATLLTDALLKQDGETVSIEHMVNSAVSNVICSVTFGQRFDYNDTSFQNILKNVNEAVRHSTIRMSLPEILPFTKYLPTGSSKKIRSNYKTSLRFHNTLASEHKARVDPENIRDIMDAYLLEIKKRENIDNCAVFNENNMQWVINDLFTAGTETTNTTLLWVFLFLLNNPDIEVKLRAQLNEVVGQNRSPRYSDRLNLPLVEAVVSESLRIGTSSNLSFPHVTATDAELHGFTIPKGTIVLPNFYALFTNREKWEDPETFHPERFLDKDGKFIKRKDFIPFSAGPRVCLGEQLARMEIFIFLTHILQKVSFSVPRGSKAPPPVGIEGFIIRPPPYDVLITKVEN